MSKKVLIISTSLRRHSNSHALAEEFAKGAKEAGHQVELISLIGRQIEYCVGCLSCQRTGQCVIEDDGPHVSDRAVSGLEGWIECFAKAELAGSLFAGGVTGPGEIANHPALAKAYDMGKNI